MATLDLGKIKLVNRGTWASGSTYTADDIVQYTDGGILSTYICVVASSQGHAPSSSGTTHASWNFLAKGVTDNIPTQSGQSGKFLTTNGSALSFASVEAFVSGMILIWSGAANAIPACWVLCDGTNSTPNLAGKFVVGYHDGNGDYDVGDTGGAETVTLTTAQIPSHKHDTNIDGQHVIPGGGGSSYPYGGAGTYASRLFSMSNTGGGGAHENRPPFYALCYIMKT